MPPTPSRPTRRHAPPGPPRPAAPHDPEAPSDSYSTALTWTPSFPTDEVSGKPGVVHTAMLLTRVHERLLPTALAQLNEPPPTPPPRLRTAARAYQNAIDDLTRQIGLTA